MSDFGSQLAAISFLSRWAEPRNPPMPQESLRETWCGPCGLTPRNEAFLSSFGRARPNGGQGPTGSAAADKQLGSS